VEDSPTQALQTRLTLESQGFAVTHAVNGMEALELARSEPPDAIMSDILMPGMDGFALVREVREDPALSKIPVVLHTATFKAEEDRAFALEAGADAFSEKGMAAEGLASLLREVIRKESASNTLDEKSFSGRHNVRLLERLLQAKRDLQEVNESLSAALVRLSAQTRQIEDITRTVDNLAHQSNLLALNASIEAAGAGEHGQGLAVVADDVRRLGDQSKNAAARVRSILTDIQKGSSEAVPATEGESNQVDAGEGLLHARAGELIRELATTDREAATAAEQLSKRYED
jgi:DNA-binding response OmpR family regulator